VAEEVKVPEFGKGRFNYANGQAYEGNWRLLNGRKVKHGNGKITKPGSKMGDFEFGGEEYEGDWEDDKMHGHGRYLYSSGNVYTGTWNYGVMQGIGRMEFGDRTQYEGEFDQNEMHG
jgi:hypothetical protein